MYSFRTIDKAWSTVLNEGVIPLSRIRNPNPPFSVSVRTMIGCNLIFSGLIHHGCQNTDDIREIGCLCIGKTNTKGKAPCGIAFG